MNDQSHEPVGDDTTGLPLLRTWGAVYTFVLVLFAVYVVLLILLERAFP
jgi:hypothetical protein